MLKRRNILLFISFSLIITSLFYVVAKNVPSPFGSFRYLYAPLWLVTVTFLKPQIFRLRSIQIVILYGVLLILILEHILWIYMSDWYKKSILEEFYALVTAVTLMSYFLVSKDYRGWALLSKWALIFIFITGLMTVIATSIMPSIARQATAGFEGLPEMGALYNRTGSGGYGFGQALCMVFPILIYYIKFGNITIISRRFLFVGVLFLFIVVLRIQTFGNIIVAFFIIIISFLGVKRVRLSIAVILFVSIIAIALPSQVYSMFLTLSGQFFSVESENYSKIYDMNEFVLDPTLDESTSVSIRVNRYPLLIEAFIEKPLLGNASYDSPQTNNLAVGAHLHWMSRLTVWGILGFTFYLFMFYKLFKQVTVLFNRQFRFYYALSISAYFFLGLLKTLAGRESFIVLFVVLPGLYFLQFSLDQKKTIINKVSN
jgi:hypothetical protein